MSELNGIVVHQLVSELENWLFLKEHIWCQNKITHTILNKSQQVCVGFFVDIENVFLKFVWKGKGTEIAETTLENE